MQLRTALNHLLIAIASGAVGGGVGGAILLAGLAGTMTSLLHGIIAVLLFGTFAIMSGIILGGIVGSPVALVLASLLTPLGRLAPFRRRLAWALTGAGAGLLIYRFAPGPLSIFAYNGSWLTAQMLAWVVGGIGAMMTYHALISVSFVEADQLKG